ncbi:lipase [Neosynechococcus sphagnicola sy1]|uniref:Lipase n=1 Tax=Neosynechococcus sphagnicola sy1 TaxID=1497020 RepID=A0A098TIS0_9CYAN|nr:alpha/beta hydrolase [Neosynechococcus sphagnicola]KGF72455.1 lipase [Neosynechococcus sphagnicola sy1]
MPLPTVILPGYFAGAEAYRGLEQFFQAKGYPVVTVPLRRQDWLPTVGGRSMAPILQPLDRTIQQVLQQYQVSQVNLVGHSAGGWIARIYLGAQPYWGRSGGEPWAAHPQIKTLVTLGTPHRSRERWTLRNLDFVNTHYPGAFYPNVRYVCVAGKAIYGERRWGAWIAYSSYQLTDGQGNVWGDGIIPIAAAHLEGAENVVLDQVQHSPKPGSLWYGSPEVLPSWISYLQ